MSSANGRSPAPDDDVSTETVADERLRLRAAGRAALGVTGATDRVRLRDVLSGGAGRRGYIAFGLAGVATAWPMGVLIASVPELAGRLGREQSEIVDAALQLLLVAGMVGFAVAALVHGRSRRPALLAGPAIAGLAGVALLAADAIGLYALLGGVAVAASVAVARPLMLDLYEPGGRPRLLGGFRAAQFGAVALAAMVQQIAGLDAAIGAGIAVAVGSLPLLATIQDPGVGAPDLRRVRAVVSDDVVVDDDFGTRREALSRLGSRPTATGVLVVQAVAGIAMLPLLTFMSFLITDRFGGDSLERPVMLAIIASAAVLAVVFDARHLEAAYRASDEQSLTQAAAFQIAVLPLLIVAVFMPGPWLTVLVFAIAIAAQTLTISRVDTLLLSVLPPRVRSFAAAAGTAMFAIVGGAVGLSIMSGIDSRFGSRWAVALAGLPALAGAVTLRRASAHVLPDLDRTIDGIVSEQQVLVRRNAGQHIPLLAARGINFGYGQVQILFGVDFTVDEGEMVALLGTNGAGKSTLLRVISGLGQPWNGSVRMEGHDITYASTSARVQAGISQVPGGKAVFGPMSVIENLRVYGYSLGADRKTVDAGIEKSMDVFPRLGERRNQLAQTLSGGEQQMLALSKALILKPRLLLIDELSLGLAPVIVADLLKMVREINSQGTAVVLVEQSVNVALSLVDHAYYMEKGEVRFDGPAQELLDRPDILRSVYLQGAAAGLGA